MRTCGELVGSRGAQRYFFFFSHFVDCWCVVCERRRDGEVERLVTGSRSVLAVGFFLWRKEERGKRRSGKLDLPNKSSKLSEKRLETFC